MYDSLQLKPNGKYLYTLTTPQVDSIPLMSVYGAVGMGHGLIGFPHTASTVMSLMDLGFNDIPHPMDNPSVWTPKGKFDPFDYQLETGKYITSYANSWVLSGLGSGKTASCIWASEFLRETKEAHKILILCPLSTVERVWVKEVFDLYPERTVGVVTGVKTKKLNILRRDYDYYIVNHDGLRQDYILQELKTICPDIIILDEATAMKNGGTSRYESLEELYNHCGSKLWAVTATPAPNGPQDMYAMQKLIDPSTVPSSLTSWKSTTMWKVDRFKWVPRKGHEKIVERAMQPAIRFMREDIPKIGKPVEYNAPLTKEQMKIFAAVRDEMIAEVQHQKDHTILAVNAAVKLSKLLQICSGNVYDINKDVVYLPNPERLAILDEVLEQAGAMHNTKVIIFVPFKNAQLQIERYLTSKKYATALVNGDTPKGKRTDIFRHFQESHDPRVLVAHPKVAAHGLTLTAASVVMWYGPHFSLELYEQGNGRIARIGQEQDLTLVHIGSHDIEWEVYNILRKRGATQNAVLSMYDRIIKLGK